MFLSQRAVDRRIRHRSGLRSLRMEPLESKRLLAADVVISEFLADNTKSLADQDQDFEDWIEITNRTASTVSMSGWHLTDDRNELQRWAFPDVELSAGERLVVFASGKNRTDPNGDIHTNFRLDRDGEYLALVRPDSSRATEFAPRFPPQLPDVSYGTGQLSESLVAVAPNVAADVLVPQDGSLGTHWTTVGFDSSDWNENLLRTTAPVAITEIGTGALPFVEVANVVDIAVETSGWTVAVNDGSTGDINAVHSTHWSLPTTMGPGGTLYRTGSPADHYWGAPIQWPAGGNGWAMIVDDRGSVVDFVAWGYDQSLIDAMQVEINGFVIGGDAPVAVSEYVYRSTPGQSHGPSGQYPDLTGSLLTDGVIGTTDWRTRYVGTQDPNHPGNSGLKQPRIDFAFDSLRQISSVTIHYMVDHSAGIFAPDEVQVLVSTSGLEGPFSAVTTSTAFNDTPDSNATTYFGDARSVTIELPAVEAHAIRLDFLNDREWTFLSEVEFTQRVSNVPWSGPSLESQSQPQLGLQRIGTGDHDVASDFSWHTRSVGAVNQNLQLPFEFPPVRTGIGFSEDGTYAADILTDLEGAMHARNATAYVRIPFHNADADVVAQTLRMKYDDGFIAYLNGQEIARRNAPQTATWNASATASRTTAAGSVYEEVDLLPLDVAIPQGTNVLAIHAMNEAAGDSDFLLLPELIVARRVDPVERLLYFSRPTPGTSNSLGLASVAAAPQLSLQPGTYVGTQQVVITAPAGTIHYTLDGSEPTASSPVYDGPITIDRSTFLRTRALVENAIPSVTVDAAYLVLDPELAGRSSNLPLIVIDTMGDAIPPSGSDIRASSITTLIDSSVNGRATLLSTPDFVGRGGLRVRGSSSTVWPKKNFSFETWDANGNDLDVGVLGMPAESDWVLFASYLDRTLVQDALVHDLARQMGRYDVRTRPVELYLNTGAGPITEADYHGVYIFMERIKRGDDRVDIANLEPTDNQEPEISGGYILKIDRGNATIPATLSRDFVPVDPEEGELTAAQSAWISDYIHDFETALSGPNFADPEGGYAKYIDVDAWIDYYWMTELTYNVDEWYLSTFLHKDRGGKLVLGPFWDFDRSLGNTNQLGGAGVTGWYSDALIDFFAGFHGVPRDAVVEFPWFRRLFEDPNFYQRHVDRWHELRQTVFSEENIFATIDEMTLELQEAQARNFARWDILDANISPSPRVFGTYEEHVIDLKRWISGRLAWIDSQFLAAPVADPEGGRVAAGTNVTLSVPGPPTVVETALVTEDANVRWLVPPDGGLGTSWRQRTFNDSDWNAGQNGVGYEQFPGVGVNYQEFVHTPVPFGTVTTYVRAEFDLSEVTATDRLVLRARYDDGFVAYLNGVEVARANAPAILAHNSTATAIHDDSAAVVYRDFDISSSQHLLVAGTNVLAIHALNFDPTSSDFLIQVQLVSESEQPAEPLDLPVYYTLDGTDPRQAPTTASGEPWIAAGAAATAWVPTQDIGTAWREPDYNDTTWTDGLTGVGYERNPGDPINFQDRIGLDIGSQIDAIPGGVNEYKGVYTRIPFTVADPTTAQELLLRMQFDDGFVAYLNGTEIARANAPDNPVWNSGAVANRADNVAVQFEEFDITPHRHLLVSGSNVLAIHGLNASIIDSDMLVLPELIARESSGDIAPTAMLYADPITIDENTTLIARTYDQGVWSAPLRTAFTVADVPVYISEIMYHPRDVTESEILAGFDDEDDFEFVELVNASNVETVDLEGVRLTGAVQAVLESRTLAPGERVVVVKDPDAFTLRYGSSATIAGTYQGNLNNSGERLTLVDGAGTELASVEYGDSLPWPWLADGAGASLVYNGNASGPSSEFGRPSTWRASTQWDGSPGTAGTAPLGIVINELLTNSASLAEPYDAIELKNTTASPVDVSGWYLSDDADEPKKFAIPQGTIIPAMGYVTFDERAFNPTPQEPNPRTFGLSGSRGEDLILTAADQEDRIRWIADGVQFGAARDGESLGRIPDGLGQPLIPLARRTLGCENHLARVGPLIVSELHYRPQPPSAEALAMDPLLTASDLEFIELYNPTREAVDLSGWRVRGGVELDLPNGTTIGPSATIVLVPFDPSSGPPNARADAFRAEYGISSEVTLLGPFGGQLSNDGEWIELQQPGAPPDDDPLTIPYFMQDGLLYDTGGAWPELAPDLQLAVHRAVPTGTGVEGEVWSAGVPTPGSVDWSTAVPGDFTGDGQRTAVDLDVLLAAARAGSSVASLDLDASGAVDLGDVQFWLRDLAHTSFGDANLDGSVDAIDFGIWETHRFQSCTSWSTGDFNGDAVTDGSDFNLWNASKFVAVPGAQGPHGSGRTPKAPAGDRSLPARDPAIANLENRFVVKSQVTPLRIRDRAFQILRRAPRGMDKPIDDALRIRDTAFADHRDTSN